MYSLFNLYIYISNASFHSFLPIANAQNLITTRGKKKKEEEEIYPSLWWYYTDFLYIDNSMQRFPCLLLHFCAFLAALNFNCAFESLAFLALLSVYFSRECVNKIFCSLKFILEFLTRFIGSYLCSSICTTLFFYIIRNKRP